MNWWEHYPRELNFTPVVHCSRQMAGFGQKNKAWISDEGSLTFSCILSPQSIATWTPLEVALLCRNFLQEHYHLFCHLKWPNDLVDQNGYKLGGIICHMRNNFVVVGIGLNLFPLTNPLHHDDNTFKPAYIFQKSEDVENSVFLEKLLCYFLENRFQHVHDIKKQWLRHCVHLHKKVRVQDHHHIVEGIFQGLGNFGEAILLSNDDHETRVTNGSLTFDESSDSN